MGFKKAADGITKTGKTKGTNLGNTEASFIAEIPVFVRQAEQRIYNSVQFPSLRKNVTGSAGIS
jgi:hypothetical protein